MSWLQSIKNRLTGAKYARATPCYKAIVAAARQPRFYQNLAIPDTPQGRFEMIMLHAWLVMNRIAEREPEFTQDLFDLMFADFDTSLRELGVGDLGVGHRVKGWAQAFYGRVAAYKTALADEALMDEALARNIFAGQKSQHTKALAFYVRCAVNSLDTQAPADIMAGRISWPD
ncbi:MAG: ubiquinol-cytochrome C chaperone family protein [Bdellovibrionales bacterium]